MKALKVLSKNLRMNSAKEFFDKLTDKEKIDRQDEFRDIACKRCHKNLRRHNSAYCGRCIHY